ncbi:hypothetical protein PG2072B_0662 [Bifidobacterium pseudolongum subsp. globosum]|uniref:Uncharacterized protein n=1 Tax=Bifidobacterium pseudolongum subsp. globosum TaxID=1690 RepID=A0A4Q5BDS8_9BIFI|nr:hypothetical protein PG2072B_0662 [Bifidobacterium pseudolongum subsp. globosum]
MTGSTSLVPSGPVESSAVVVERAARKPEPAPQVPRPHGEHAGQMQHQTGLPGVGQVVRVCAPLFSQQLLGVSDGLHLDLEFQAFGPQGRQLRDELVAFPTHVPDRPSRAGRRRRIVPYRLRRAPRILVMHPVLLVVVRKHRVLPVSHDIGAHTQLLADPATGSLPARIPRHRPPPRRLVHRRAPQPAPARLQLVDPTRQHLVARIPQRAQRAPQTPPMLQIVIDRGAFLLERVTFPAPVVKRAAAIAAGLDPCPMPARQHPSGRIPQLVDRRRRAAIVPLVQPHRTKPLLPRIPRHQWTPFPLKSPTFLHHLKTKTPT